MPQSAMSDMICLMDVCVDSCSALIHGCNMFSNTLRQEVECLYGLS